MTVLGRVIQQVVAHLVSRRLRACLPLLFVVKCKLTCQPANRPMDTQSQIRKKTVHTQFEVPERKFCGHSRFLLVSAQSIRSVRESFEAQLVITRVFLESKHKFVPNPRYRSGDQ